MITPSHVDHGVQTVVYHTLYGENRALGLPSDVALAIHALRSAIDERDEAAGGGAAAAPAGGAAGDGEPEVDAELVARLEARALRRCPARGVLQCGSFAGGADEALVILPRGGHAVQTGAFKVRRPTLSLSPTLSGSGRSRGAARARPRLAHVPCLTRALASSPRAVVHSALARPKTHRLGKVARGRVALARGQPRGRGRRGERPRRARARAAQVRARHAPIARGGVVHRLRQRAESGRARQGPQGRARLRRPRRRAHARAATRRDGRARRAVAARRGGRGCR